MTVAPGRRRGRRHEMGGIFDWIFRKKPPASGLPAEIRPEKAKLPSIFDVFPGAPGSLVPAEPKKQLPSFFQAFDPGSQVIRLPAKEIFQAFKESPKEEPKKEAAEGSSWTGMFEAEAPGEAVEAFRFVDPSPEKDIPGRKKPAESRRERGIVSPDDWPNQTRPIWMDTDWDMPSVRKMQDLILDRIRNVDVLMDEVVSNTESPWWSDELMVTFQTHEPARMDLIVVAGYMNAYEDLAVFFDVPEEVVDRYMEEGAQGDVDPAYYFDTEVIQPLVERFSEAMDQLKPPGGVLPGWFSVVPDDTFDWWVAYLEFNRPS